MNSIPILPKINQDLDLPRDSSSVNLSPSCDLKAITTSNIYQQKPLIIPILPPINKTEVKKEIKVINKKYNHSLHVAFDVEDVSVKVIELSDDFKLKCPYIRSKNGNVYFLFQPLIKPFTNANNNQRLLYRFKSPEEKFSKDGKMFLTRQGLLRYIKLIEKGKKRKNGIFNKDITEPFIKCLSSLC